MQHYDQLLYLGSRNSDRSLLSLYRQNIGGIGGIEGMGGIEGYRRYRGYRRCRGYRGFRGYRQNIGGIGVQNGEA